MTPSSARSVPIPTIVWNAIRTTFTGGRSFAGTASRPCTVAFQLWNERSESRCGISIPPLIWPFAVYQPPMCSPAPLVVWASPSNAASFVGCVVATSRAAQSPTRTCTGDASAATVSGIASAVRS